MTRRHLLRSAAALPLAQFAHAQTAPSATKPLQIAPRFGDGRDWWFQRRFGMFVHWGIYAIHGLHEQEQWRYRVPRAE
ncbi:MAG TPA: alpha-L-fucosidase, partial [Candidatus Solibacter sp.]|nr:alpha-L-fucosidase [Candidatus Solibacter sp.]